MRDLIPNQEMPQYLPMEETGYIVVKANRMTADMVVNFKDIKNWSLWHGFLVFNYEDHRVMIPRESIQHVEVKFNSPEYVAAVANANAKAIRMPTLTTTPPASVEQTIPQYDDRSWIEEGLDAQRAARDIEDPITEKVRADLEAERDGVIWDPSEERR